jgi:hypothetical protein
MVRSRRLNVVVSAALGAAFLGERQRPEAFVGSRSSLVAAWW